jgi:hypothetical protein
MTIPDESENDSQLELKSVSRGAWHCAMQCLTFRETDSKASWGTFSDLSWMVTSVGGGGDIVSMLISAIGSTRVRLQRYPRARVRLFTMRRLVHGHPHPPRVARRGGVVGSQWG